MIQEPSLLSQEESGFLTLFQDFLAAHADPEGGNRLHALYAEEAPVALEGRLLRVERIRPVGALVSSNLTLKAQIVR